MFINAFVFHNQTSVSLSESENFNVLFSDRSSDSESSKPIKIHISAEQMNADEYKLNLQILIFLVYCCLSTRFVSRPPRSQAVPSQTSAGRTGSIPH